jgi:tungstate transport system substrate-binding protein
MVGAMAGAKAGAIAGAMVCGKAAVAPRRRFLAALAAAALAGHPVMAAPGGAAPAGDAPPLLKVAAVGGLTLCGTWPRLAARLEAALGIRIETVASGPKEIVVPSFAGGEAALLLIQGSDASFALLADGTAAPLRAWGMNEHVIMGPDSDPAGVRGAGNAVEAMRRIARAQGPFIAFRDPGSHGIVEALWREAGVRAGPWVLPDTSARPQSALLLADEKRAYAVVGHIPVRYGKMPRGGLQVLMSGDPAMRRVYVAVEPGPRHPAGAAERALARRVTDYLVSPAGQADLAAADMAAGGPWIFPLPRP